MQVTARSDIFAYASKFILQQSFGVLVQSVRFKRLKGSRRLLRKCTNTTLLSHIPTSNAEAEGDP